MASVYLKGGPCDGQTRTLTAAEADTGELVCKDALYRNPYTGAHHDGAIVFTFAGKAPAPGSSAAVLPRGHRGWNHFNRALAHELPTKLRRSREIRRHVLRKLGAPHNLGR